MGAGGRWSAGCDRRASRRLQSLNDIGWSKRGRTPIRRGVLCCADRRRIANRGRACARRARRPCSAPTAESVGRERNFVELRSTDAQSYGQKLIAPLRAQFRRAPGCALLFFGRQQTRFGPRGAQLCRRTAQPCKVVRFAQDDELRGGLFGRLAVTGCKNDRDVGVLVCSGAARTIESNECLLRSTNFIAANVQVSPPGINSPSHGARLECVRRFILLGIPYV